MTLLEKIGRYLGPKFKGIQDNLVTLNAESHTHANKALLDSIDQDLSTSSTTVTFQDIHTKNITIHGNITVDEMDGGTF